MTNGIILYFANELSSLLTFEPSNLFPCMEQMWWLLSLLHLVSCTFLWIFLTQNGYSGPNGTPYRHTNYCTNLSAAALAVASGNENLSIYCIHVISCVQDPLIPISVLGSRRSKSITRYCCKGAIPFFEGDFLLAHHCHISLWRSVHLGQKYLYSVLAQVFVVPKCPLSCPSCTSSSVSFLKCWVTSSSNLTTSPSSDSRLQLTNPSLTHRP